MNTQNIKTRLAGFDNVHFYGPVDQAAIDAAQADLGVVFPPEYRQFLSVFGCGSIESEELVGLGGPEHLNVVWLKRQLTERHKPLPRNFLPLRSDGGGNYDCIDLGSATNNGEYAIVEWRHDGSSTSQCSVLASSYFEWFESVLRLIEEA